MAEIMGTVTSIKRYLSPEKIELKISPDMGPENTITLPQNRRYIIPDFQREIRWEENNLSISNIAKDGGVKVSDSAAIFNTFFHAGNIEFFN